MHTLLFGLFAGYFLAACAPVHWQGAELATLSGMIVVLGLILMKVGLGGQLKLRLCVSLVKFALAAAVSALILGGAASQASIPNSPQRQCLDESLLLRIQVDGLPTQTVDGSRFDARILDVDSQKPQCQLLEGERLRLGFRGASWLAPDQVLLASVRLREIRGSVSPGAFDHELYSARRGVLFGGYVVQAYALREQQVAAVNSLVELPASFDGLRFSLRRYLQSLDLANVGILLALAVGDTALLSSEDWALLQNTGTVHLLVISGLHVGMVSVVLFFLLRGPVLLLMVITGRSSRWVAPLQASSTSVAVLLYVQLTGAGVPAQRAWFMATVVLISWAMERRLQPGFVLLTAFCGVVAMQPLAGLTPGFWLSFALVAWLLFGLKDTRQRQPSDSLWLRLRAAAASSVAALKMHIGCTFMLLPVLIWLGLPVAPLGPIANFFAVPFVTLALVPLILLCLVAQSVSLGFAAEMFAVADRLVDVLLFALRALVEHWPAVSLPQISLTTLGFLMLLLLVALSRVGLALRVSAACAVLLFSMDSMNTQSSESELAPKLPKAGEFNLRFLDVGQGLAVLVQTAETEVLYDTGAAFPSGFNYARAVISPSIRGLRRVGSGHRLGGLVVSHGDIDHSGGAAEILREFNPKRSAGAVAGANAANSCRWHSLKGDRPKSDGEKSSEGKIWRSAGVRLELIQFFQGDSSNNKSCVLVVHGVTAKAVLSGDIEAAAESALLDRLPGGVDVLSVPHHGSATSSTKKFVERLHPGIAVVSAGYQNRFGHPHPAVVSRYRSHGTSVLVTAQHGTMDWSSEDVGVVRSWRLERAREWQLGAPLAAALGAVNNLPAADVN